MRTPIWINLACGTTRLPKPWRNHDIDMDVTNPLPFADNSVQYIIIGHCVEHLTSAELYGFLEEAQRVLQKGGILRVAFPDVGLIMSRSTMAYCQWLQSKGWGDGTFRSAIKNIACNHGHMQCLTSQTMRALLYSLDFSVTEYTVGKSIHEDLVGVEGHGAVISDEFNRIETCVLEAVK